MVVVHTYWLSLRLSLKRLITVIHKHCQPPLPLTPPSPLHLTRAHAGWGWAIYLPQWQYQLLWPVRLLKYTQSLTMLLGADPAPNTIPRFEDNKVCMTCLGQIVGCRYPCNACPHYNNCRGVWAIHSDKWCRNDVCHPRRRSSTAAHGHGESVISRCPLPPRPLTTSTHRKQSGVVTGRTWSGRGHIIICMMNALSDAVSAKIRKRYDI